MAGSRRSAGRQSRAKAGVLVLTASIALFPAGLQAEPSPRSVREATALLEEIVGNRFYPGNAVRLLLDGPQTYAAMLAAIDAAEHHVHLETYIIADDEVGERFARALIDAAERGVAVRMIYDAIGSLRTPGAFFERLEQHGVGVHEYNDPSADLDTEDADTRDHRKLLIVDGKVAFTGGINIDRHYLEPSEVRGGSGQGHGWRDTHLEIRGPSVAVFEERFVTLWTGLEGPLDEALFTPADDERAGSALVQVLDGVGGNEDVSHVRLVLEAAAKTAQERIWITQSYFAPDDLLTEAIMNAAARGVDVRLLLAGHSDSRLVVNASRSYYTDLLEHGVRIFESEENMLHAKTMVVDGIWSTIGSSNFDYLSFLHNHEINAVVVDPMFAARMEEVFESDITNAVEIVLEKWERRSLWQRMKEIYSRFMRYRL